MFLFWIYFRFFLMTFYFEESIIIGTRAIFGLSVIRLRKRIIVVSVSSIFLFMLISIICASFFIC